MARGWESKAVESQIEQAATKTDDREDRWNPEQVEIRQKRDGLLLSRARVLQDLETARHPRHRNILQAALDHLERELAKLS
jgi:hypothetical protein